MRYLLERPQQSSGHQHKKFAFQSGPDDEAAAQWFEKGVTPIVYELAKDGTRPVRASNSRSCTASDQLRRFDTQPGVVSELTRLECDHRSMPDAWGCADASQLGHNCCQLIERDISVKEHR